MFGCCIRNDDARPVFEEVTDEKPVETQKAEEPKSTPPPEEPKYVEEPAPAPAPAPAPPSTKNSIVFTTPQGEDVSVTFVKGPIGISFTNEFPIKAERVQGHAQELGVQPGWLFKSIQGSPCAGKDFASLKAELVSLSQALKAGQWWRKEDDIDPSK
mmetsp:Transcript_140030/g.247471  ORF Transcript_140030/g.247471 Transcript_140030/m.247471 type:complete len:157 (+) Transcript_140030:90-560(+)